jgi:hypothetical protein
MIIMITLLSSAVAVVEISEVALIYAPVMDLARLQFPLIVIYDAVLLSACIWGYFITTAKLRHRLTVYAILGVLLAIASTFVGMRLSDQESMRMRSSVCLMKRAVMFGFLAAIVSFHTVVGVRE